MKKITLLMAALLCAVASFAQSTLPVVSIFPLHGNQGDRVTAAVYAGFTDSKRVRIVDREQLRLTQGELETVAKGTFNPEEIAARTGMNVGAQYLLSGNVTNVNFGGYRSGNYYTHTCEVEARVQLTTIETSVSEIKILKGSASSTTSNHDALLKSALSSLSANARSYARDRFPALGLKILEIKETSEKKGIVSFTVEGEGLTVRSGRSAAPYIGDFLPAVRTKIEIKQERDVTRPDGTMRTVLEPVAEAKIKIVEDGGSEGSPTALCIVTEGGKKLQEMLQQKVRLVLKTIN